MAIAQKGWALKLFYDGRIVIDDEIYENSKRFACIRISLQI